VSPDVGSGRTENRWTSPDIARCRWTFQVISAACQPMDDPAGNFIPLGWTAYA
jgi:hypothetical protein